MVNNSMVVGDGGHSKYREKYLSGNYHVELGNFVNFFRANVIDLGAQNSVLPTYFYTNNCVLHKLFCALLSSKCMISIFNREAVQNVYADFRSYLK